MILLGLTFAVFLLLVATYISQITTPNDIENLSNDFLRLVSVEKDFGKVQKMFCENGTIFGPKFFDTLNLKSFFHNELTNLCIIAKKFSVVHVQGDVFLNQAKVSWMWDGLQVPVETNMSFLFKGKKIFHLHLPAKFV